MPEALALLLRTWPCETFTSSIDSTSNQTVGWTHLYVSRLFSQVVPALPRDTDLEYLPVSNICLKEAKRYPSPILFPIADYFSRQVRLISMLRQVHPEAFTLLGELFVPCAVALIPQRKYSWSGFSRLPRQVIDLT